MGCLGCPKKYLNSDLDKYGLGMTSYFKTLKSLLWSLGIIVLLNVIVYFIYISSHTEQTPNTLNEYLFKSTIGNIGSSKLLKYFVLDNILKDVKNFILLFSTF